MPNENSQIAVTAILRELGVDPDFKCKDDRLAIQKSIYLAQAAGVKLNYWFDWYLNGPYCSSLADDYYEARKDLSQFNRYKVSPVVQSKLSVVRELLSQKPDSVTAQQWLEALASLDFIMRVQKQPPAEAVSLCKARKPHLIEIVDNALASLLSSGLKM